MATTRRPDAEELALAFLLADGHKQQAEDTRADNFEPTLTSAQTKAYKSTARALLADGERFSGKTYTLLHRLVRHMWRNHNAHALIITRLKRTANVGGAFEKLMKEVLPQWGAGQKGFRFSDSFENTEKDKLVWVQNRYGGAGLIQLVSIPYGQKLAGRVKGMEVSAVLVDELTDIGGEEYFDDIDAQIGRRPHVPPEEQYYSAACNPAGPSHWVYKKWFEDNKLENGDPDPWYERVHIPFKDNPSPQAQSYYERLRRIHKNDPIKFRRMIEGEWVDYSSGTAIFGMYYVPEIHVRGNAKENLVLIPRRGVSICMGYDVGDVNHAVSFLQQRPVADRMVWSVFDEIVFAGEEIPQELIAKEVLRKWNYWGQVTESALSAFHISDLSAFNRYRSTTGSYDFKIIQDAAKEELEKNPHQYPWVRQGLRLLPCPKPKGSVAARVRETMGHLYGETLFVSDRCEHHKAMFEKLQSEKGDAFAPAKTKDAHIHVFDAMSYVLLYNALGRLRKPKTDGRGLTGYGDELDNEF